MKKRFKNILTKNGKKKCASVAACAAALSIGLGTLTGCSAARPDAGNPDSSSMPGTGEGQDSSSVDQTPADLITQVSFGETVERDLNGDGTAETISSVLKTDEGYDPIPELTISGKTFDSTYMRDTLSVYTANAKTDYYYFLDLDTSDSYVEIGFFDYGASDDPYTWVFRYNGDSLALLGGFTAAPDEESTVIQGDGTVSAVTRCDIIQTDSTIGTWKLAGEELKKQELTEGEFLLYRSLYGSEYPVTARRDFRAFPADPLSSAVVAIPKGTEVAIQSFKKSKDSNNIDIYFYFEDEQGTKHDACIRMEDGDLFKIILPDETTTSTEVFDGLAFAG